MKICLISFDFFDFDNYIVKELQKMYSGIINFLIFLNLAINTPLFLKKLLIFF